MKASFTLLWRRKGEKTPEEKKRPQEERLGEEESDSLIFTPNNLKSLDTY